MLIEDFHGVPFERPLTRTEETIEVFRQLMTGEEVHYDGETVDINGAQLDFAPSRSTLPVYMGVTGPRMLKLAGAIADGIILNTFISEDYIRNAIDLIEEGVKEADRGTRPDLGTIVAYSTSSDARAAKEAVKPMLAEYVFNLPGLEQARLDVGDAFLERDDVTKEVMKPVREITEAEGIEAAAEYVPDWVLDQLAAAGTPEECNEMLEKYFEFGFDFLLPSFMGGNIGYAIDSIADHFGLDQYAKESKY